MRPDGRPQRVTLPTLQILAAFMSDLARDDWYGRALSVHTGLGSGAVLQRGSHRFTVQKHQPCPPAVTLERAASAVSGVPRGYSRRHEWHRRR